MRDAFENHLPKFWLAALGGLAGGCGTFAYGFYQFLELRQPLPPNVGRCGLSVFGTFLLMVVGPAIFAPLLTCAGYLLGSVLELWRLRAAPEYDESED